MKRLAALFLISAFMAVPGFSAETKKAEEKEAIKQCKTEYATAKKEAGEKKTHKERGEAKKEAKKHYEECVEKAKHKS
jgi:hypothetical protein